MSIQPDLIQHRRGRPPCLKLSIAIPEITLFRTLLGHCEGKGNVIRTSLVQFWRDEGDFKKAATIAMQKRCVVSAVTT